MKPFYLFDPRDPRIAQYKQWFESLERSPEQSIELLVSKHNVKHAACSSMGVPLICMQHFPSMIERFTLAVDLNFEGFPKKISANSDYDWVNLKTIKWLSLVPKVFPPIPFIVKDIEVRFHTLLGDYFVKGKIPMRSLSSSMGRLYLSDFHREVVSKRLFLFSSFFYVYCLGSGFDPIESIKTVYESLKTPFFPDVIIKNCERNIAVGNPYGLTLPN